MRGASFHESFDREEETKRSSERAFGIVFVVVFTLIGLWPWFFGGTVRWWAVGIAVTLLLVALIAPQLLTPANRLWAAFGLLLHRITNPLIMGLLFFAVITPIGLLRRLFVRDPLQMRKRPTSESYWQDRDDKTNTSMERQF